MSRKYSLNENCMDDVSGELVSYFLGFFYADGHVSSISKRKDYRLSITLSKKDRTILELFRQRLFNTNKKLGVSIKKGTPYTRLDIDSKRLWTRMRELGVEPSDKEKGIRSKSYTSTFPTIDRLNYKAFVRGCFDGDGSVTLGHRYKKDRNAFYFYTKVTLYGTKMFCEGLSEYLLKEGIRSTVSLNKKGTETYQISILGGVQGSLYFLGWLYKNSLYYLPRKKAKYLELIEEITMSSLLSQTQG